MTNRSYFRHQEAGQEALKEKRFRAAKGAFDKALVQASQDSKISASVLIAILDLRVETQLKLRELDGALKDACTMVRYARTDPRGYLRCGQLSRLKKDLVEAQKWYDRGLRNIPKTNDLYSRVEMVRSHIASKLGWGRQNTLQDPFVVLPMEIIHMISERLNLREATVCLRVSTTWRNSLLAIPGLWRTIDLLSARKNVKVSNVRACIRRLSVPPSTIRLDKLTVSALTYLRPYLERWKTIEHLSINAPDLLDLSCTWTLPIAIETLHLGQQCVVCFSVVDDILHHCDMLQYARFDAILKLFLPTEPSHAMVEAYAPLHRKTNLPALTHLVLNSVSKSYPEVESENDMIEPPAFFRDFPNLTTIQCYGFGFSESNADLSTAQCLRRLRLEASFVEHNFRLPSSLEVLICKDSTFCRPRWLAPPPFVPISDQEVQPRESLSRLRVLELDGIIRPSPRLINIIKESPFATLTRLDLTYCAMDISDFMTLLESGKLSKLTFLRTSHFELTDSHMQRIAAGCTLLEYVELRGSKITGVAVKLLCSVTAIKTLKLSNCLQVSADAIDWARAKGLQVIVNQMEEGAGLSGQRVHYG